MTPESHRESQRPKRSNPNRVLGARLRRNPNRPMKSHGHKPRLNPRLKFPVEVAHPPLLSEVVPGAAEEDAAARAEAGNRPSLKLSPPQQ